MRGVREKAKEERNGEIAALRTDVQKQKRKVPVGNGVSETDR